LSSAPPDPDQPSSPEPGAEDVNYDPFRFGRPEAGSPAARAFPHLFPSTAPGSYQTPTAGYQPPVGYQPPGYHPDGYGPSGYPPPGGQFSGGAYPPPGYSGYPQPSSGPTASSNGAAPTGLILGLVSVVLIWLTIFDIPLIVLGIVFSRRGLKAAVLGLGHRSMALWGLILSIVAAVALVALMVVFVPRIQHCENQNLREGTTAFNSCVLGTD
jgi:hypothetical protein